MKRILTWRELPDLLRKDALAVLNRRATLRAEQTGQTVCYAWAERVAPLCRFTTTNRQQKIWDVEPIPSLKKQDVLSVFEITPLSLEQINTNSTT